MLTCPVCARPLSLEERRAVCPAGHSFDRAKEGYCNLLLSSASHGHGDDKAMLTARRAFLEKGYYEPLRDALCQRARGLFSPGDAVVDAGCGEGYYTHALAKTLAPAGVSPIFAFDIAKEAARMTAKKLGDAAFVFVGSAYHMPFAPASLRGIFSLFSPFAQEEFLRVLAPGGFLFRVYPLPEHLYALKAALYDAPRIRDDRPETAEAFRLLEETQVRREIRLEDREEILSLFGMTPFFHKTGRADAAKLEKLSSLTVECAFGIALYQKGS